MKGYLETANVQRGKPKQNDNYGAFFLGRTFFYKVLIDSDLLFTLRLITVVISYVNYILCRLENIILI